MCWTKHKLKLIYKSLSFLNFPENVSNIASFLKTFLFLTSTKLKKIVILGLPLRGVCKKMFRFAPRQRQKSVFEKDEIRWNFMENYRHALYQKFPKLFSHMIYLKWCMAKKLKTKNKQKKLQVSVCRHKFSPSFDNAQV